LTDRQARFAEGIIAGKDQVDAYIDAGYKAKSRQVGRVNAYRLLHTNDNVQVYLQGLRDERARVSAITRTSQQRRLQQIADAALADKQYSAAVSALREVNSITGLHRELAPNDDRQEQRRRAEAERKRLELIARNATSQRALPSGKGVGA
jgi:phage terminase small subunit